ncbi:hypothetical protein SLEP1_g35414 [Rubroshorea leprosula]|uniref:Uncharacterized protein n=1 Tax=Rubroshorea leprosula TaxID=152421 RepID=A0AAV5KN32_9ROSI|nr:hypothetical protein SLEP1_g35414 [Rubroshorea leprosula]
MASLACSANCKAKLLTPRYLWLSEVFPSWLTTINCVVDSNAARSEQGPSLVPCPFRQDP